MASTTQCTESQQQLFKKWAEDTIFKLDMLDFPKRQFSILALHRGWHGGEEEWNAHWKECFDEEYTWRSTVGRTPIATHILNKLTTNHSQPNGTHTPRTPGITLLSSLWHQFEDFEPDAHAPFQSELKRLASHQDWNAEERREWRSALLESDFETYFGRADDYECGLFNWQFLCYACGIEPVPESVEACRAELTKIRINLINLVDSQRTGETVRKFATHLEYRRYTHPRRAYHLDTTDADALLKTLLHRMKPRREQAP